jgi:hypothetical protein
VIVLVARVRHHSRAYLSRLERDRAFRRLAESQRLLAEEVAQAARHVRPLLPERLTGSVGVGWRFVPSTRLGGDLFGDLVAKVRRSGRLRGTSQGEASGAVGPGRDGG